MAVTSFYWKIKSLTWANILATYVLWLMATFLTDVWRFNYQKAAVVINIFWGMVDVARFFSQYIIESYLGNCRMASLSGLLYTSGLLCLSLSALGTCYEDKESCHVKKRYKFLFYLALPQLIGGISFHRLNTIEELLRKEVDPEQVTSSTDEEQEGSRSRPNSNKNEELPGEEVSSRSRLSKRLQILNNVISIAIHFVAVFALGNYIKQWALRFGIPAMFMFMATVLFVSGSYSKQTPEPPGSFLTTMRSVIVASFSRSTSTVLNQEYNHSQTSYGRYLRCLDRAIITLSCADEEQRKMIVRNVEETKRTICRIPFCIAFFMLGVVSSIKDTYFIQQANTMDKMVGGHKLPFDVLQLSYEVSKVILTILYLSIMKKLLNFDLEGTRKHDVVSSKYVGCVGIAVSMIFAILCCFVAADVEKQRLDNVRDTIPMSMFWLVPQFFLLGGLDGILEKSIDLFFKHQAHTPSDHILGVFSSCIIGLGRVGSVLLVYAAQTITARGDNTGWFTESLNDSRLDKYYWVLVALSLGNLIYYKNYYYCTSLRSEVRV